MGGNEAPGNFHNEGVKIFWWRYKKQQKRPGKELRKCQGNTENIVTLRGYYTEGQKNKILKLMKQDNRMLL